MGRRRSSRRGCYHFLAPKGVEGLQKEGQCAILKNEIRAALRAATLEKVFRTHHRRKKEGKHIRAAKCHFEPGTARLPAASILKPHPRKGTETSLKLRMLTTQQQILKPHPRKGTETHAICAVPTWKRNFKTTSPQGDGNHRDLASLRKHLRILKPHPRKGTETILSPQIQPPHEPNFKTTSPQGDGNPEKNGSCNQTTDILKPHPRKGTETFSAKTHPHRFGEKF